MKQKVKVKHIDSTPVEAVLIKELCCQTVREHENLFASTLFGLICMIWLTIKLSGHHTEIR